MVNASKKNFSPHLTVKYSKSTKRSTRPLHHVIECKSGSEAERVQAMGALRSVPSKQKLWAEKKQETHFLSN
jgi:2'-5' RNA ligase